MRTKEVKNTQKQEYYQRNRERIIARVRAYREANLDKVEACGRKYRESHRKEAVARAKAWSLANPERARANRKATYENNKGVAKAQMRKWAEENPGRAKEIKQKYAETHHDDVIARAAAWNKAHPEVRAAIGHRHRARKVNAAIGTDRIAYKSFVKHVQTANKIRCYWCHKPVPKGRKRHIDHIIPLARGGADDVGNLCCACEACNCKKNAQLPEEFSGQHQLIFTPANP